MRPMTMLDVIELAANTEGDKILLLVLLKSMNKSNTNKENWIIITVQCIILIKRDLALISLLICVVYRKRIQDPIPYPKTSQNKHYDFTIIGIGQNLTGHQQVNNYNGYYSSSC